MRESVETPGAGRVVAVVLCAGQGTRMGASRNKIFLSLAGASVAAHAISAFERSPLVDEILVMGRADELARLRETVIARHGFAKVSGVVEGGSSRHQSEERALEALRPRILAGEIGLVMIHDGARPLVSEEDIARLVDAIHALPAPGGALLATPLAPDEHIAQVGDDGAIERLYVATELARAQTPQGGDARTLLAAYDRARAVGFEGTDTASVIEAAGAPVAIVWGNEANIKVTTRDDLLRAEATLRARGDLTPWPPPR